MKHATNVLYYMRKRLGLSQHELARATKLTANDISRIETGNIGAGIEKFITLAKFFSISLNALLRNDIYEVCPTLTERPKTSRKMLKRIQKLRKQCDEIGCSGEEWVYQQEVKKLQGTIFENAVNQNFADDEDAHFDILSFNTDGIPICIEVKTTTGDLEKAFYFTAEELEEAKECQASGVCYEVHRVYHMNNPKNRGREIISAEELFNNYTFKPVTYLVTRKAAS